MVRLIWCFYSSVCCKSAWYNASSVLKWAVKVFIAEYECVAALCLLGTYASRGTDCLLSTQYSICIYTCVCVCVALNNSFLESWIEHGTYRTVFNSSGRGIIRYKSSLLLLTSTLYVHIRSNVLSHLKANLIHFECVSIPLIVVIFFFVKCWIVFPLLKQSVLKSKSLLGDCKRTMN